MNFFILIIIIIFNLNNILGVQRVPTKKNKNIKDNEFLKFLEVKKYCIDCGAYEKCKSINIPKSRNNHIFEIEEYLKFSSKIKLLEKNSNIEFFLNIFLPKDNNDGSICDFFPLNLYNNISDVDNIEIEHDEFNSIKKNEELIPKNNDVFKLITIDSRINKSYKNINQFESDFINKLINKNQSDYMKYILDGYIKEGALKEDLLEFFGIKQEVIKGLDLCIIAEFILTFLKFGSLIHIIYNNKVLSLDLSKYLVNLKTNTDLNFKNVITLYTKGYDESFGKKSIFFQVLKDIEEKNIGFDLKSNDKINVPNFKFSRI